MEMVAAAFLGIVQGLTEFLPISSSAHLILVPWLFGWTPEGLAFDVALHVGTAAAVLAYFWKDWILLAGELIRGLSEAKPLGNQDRKLACYLIIGTIPAVAVGLTLEDVIEQRLRSPLVTVVTLVVFGLLLYYAERRSRQDRAIAELGMADVIWIGLSQATALIPGISRSGITITAALLRGLDRASAARFSFLLSTPAVVGAGVLEAKRLIEATAGASVAAAAGAPGPVEVNWLVFAVGVSFAALTGFLCIRYFLRYLRTKSLWPFVLYRLALAVVILTFYFKYWM